ncbi:MAG: ABC transporter permease [Eubacteriales bacterium]|nr:ABC transporter permease [Eubacteriales bacterium]
MKQAWQHFLQYKPLLKELVRRDLKVKYRRSFLGYVWSLLNPLLMMCVMTLVFSYMFRFDIPNYPLYLITGQTLWTFFNESTNMSMYSVLQNGALIKKVYIPKFIFPISRVLSSFVTMSFSLAAIVIVMIFTKATLYWTILLFPVPLFFLLLFAMGIGMVLSALSVYFRDITHLYGVLTLAWMYMTPIFYPVSSLPAEVLPIIQGNPMYSYITFFRDIVLYGTVPEPIMWLQCAAVSILALALGLAVFRKMQRNFILYI